jgi:DinB superfamily
MKFEMNQSIELLERTPAVLKNWLTGLDHRWIENNYGAETFRPFDVIGHLLHGERTDWMARLEIILEHGESRPFTPWDRYAMRSESQGKTIDQLLEEFAMARQENVDKLKSKKLSHSDLQRTGTHPRFGRVTLQQLLATWVTHDLNHIHQIAKCMAWQYRDEIGPWREYVTFIDR